MRTTSAKKHANRSPREARSAEERALRTMAKRLRTAADKIDLAATYWGDGAYITAREILAGSNGRGRSPGTLALQTVGDLNADRWHRS